MLVLILFHPTMALAASADSRVVQDMNMDSEISAIEDMLRKADDDICELCFIIGQYKINRSNLKIKTPKQARNVIQEYMDTLKRQNDRSSNKLVIVLTIITFLNVYKKDRVITFIWKFFYSSAFCH